MHVALNKLSRCNESSSYELNHTASASVRVGSAGS